MVIRSGILVVGAILSAAALAEDIGSKLEEEKKKSMELAKAMQNAQLLLSNMSTIFECNYTGYDVSPRQTAAGTSYLVVIDVKEDTCNDMVEALNGQGAKDNLVFVSERKMPVMKSLPEAGPFDELTAPPMDYILIHEVDPGVDQ